MKGCPGSLLFPLREFPTEAGNQVEDSLHNFSWVFSGNLLVACCWKGPNYIEESSCIQSWGQWFAVYIKMRRVIP